MKSGSQCARLIDRLLLEPPLQELQYLPDGSAGLQLVDQAGFFLFWEAEYALKLEERSMFGVVQSEVDLPAAFARSCRLVCDRQHTRQPGWQAYTGAVKPQGPFSRKDGCCDRLDTFCVPIREGELARALEFNQGQTAGLRNLHREPLTGRGSGLSSLSPGYGGGGGSRQHLLAPFILFEGSLEFRGGGPKIRPEPDWEKPDLIQLVEKIPLLPAARQARLRWITGDRPEVIGETQFDLSVCNIHVLALWYQSVLPVISV
jgi:hypothetical protein